MLHFSLSLFLASVAFTCSNILFIKIEPLSPPTLSYLVSPFHILQEGLNSISGFGRTNQSNALTILLCTIHMEEN